MTEIEKEEMEFPVCHIVTRGIHLYNEDCTILYGYIWLSDGIFPVLNKYFFYSENLTTSYCGNPSSQIQYATLSGFQFKQSGVCSSIASFSAFVVLAVLGPRYAFLGCFTLPSVCISLIVTIYW